VDERARRIGRNEALFREVNERIERVTQSLQVASETISILCECGDQTCAAQIEVSIPEYERIRKESTLFFVCSGHEQPDVRKKEGPAAEMARELDPRDDDD